MHSNHFSWMLYVYLPLKKENSLEGTLSHFDEECSPHRTKFWCRVFILHSTRQFKKENIFLSYSLTHTLAFKIRVRTTFLEPCKPAECICKRILQTLCKIAQTASFIFSRCTELDYMLALFSRFEEKRRYVQDCHNKYVFESSKNRGWTF